MAQQSQQYPGAVVTLAKNLGVNSGATETTVLDQVSCLGGRNLAVTIVNYTGTISAVALYGSPDGVNYTAVSGFSSFGVATGAMGHAEVVANWAFIRVTTTGVALIDVYLSAC